MGPCKDTRRTTAAADASAHRQNGTNGEYELVVPSFRHTGHHTQNDSSKLVVASSVSMELPKFLATLEPNQLMKTPTGLYTGVSLTEEDEGYYTREFTREFTVTRERLDSGEDVETDGARQKGDGKREGTEEAEGMSKEAEEVAEVKATAKQTKTDEKTERASLNPQCTPRHTGETTHTPGSKPTIKDNPSLHATLEHLDTGQFKIPQGPIDKYERKLPSDGLNDLSGELDIDRPLDLFSTAFGCSDPTCNKMATVVAGMLPLSYYSTYDEKAVLVTGLLHSTSDNLLHEHTTQLVISSIPVTGQVYQPPNAQGQNREDCDTLYSRPDCKPFLSPYP